MLERLRRRGQSHSHNPSQTPDAWPWDDGSNNQTNSPGFSLPKSFRRPSLSSLSPISLKPSSRNRKQVVGGWQFDALDETRPGRVMPELPRELWIEILAMASCQHLGKASGLVGSGGKYDHLQTTANGRSLGAKSDILSFSLVSKAWNTYSQPALYHTIHIRKSSQAKALALTLLSQICGGSPLPQAAPGSSYSPPPLSYSTSSSSVGSAPAALNTGFETSGRHIRYLTLSTLSYDRCNPSDVLVILSSSPHLVGFSDEGGIRCPLLEEWCDWRATPEKLLGVLIDAGTKADEKENLRASKRYSSGTLSRSKTAQLECLTWTCYPHLPLPLPIPFSRNGEFTGFNALRSLHLYLPFDTDAIDYFAGSKPKLQFPLHLPSLTKLTLTLSDPIISKSTKGAAGYTYSTPPNTLLALLAEWDLPSLRILTIDTPYTLHHSDDGRGQQHHDANDGAGERLGDKLGDGFWRFFEAHGSRIVVLEFGRIGAGSQISPRQTLSPLSRLTSRASQSIQEGYGNDEAAGYGYESTYIRDVQDMEDRWIEDQVRDADKERIEAEKLAEARREREEIESRTMPFPPPTPSSPFGPELATPLPPTSPNSVPASLPAASQPSQTLASLTPNLRTFICSASLSATHDQVLTFNGLDAFNDQVDAFDALEWDWTHPDWIAPHPLLPSHPNVRMIGIRDIGERVRADWEERDERDGWDQSQFGFHDDNEGGHNPFFTLYLQLSSLLLPSTDDSGPDVPGPSTRRERQKVPFPSLKYIRDLDPDSDLLRRGVRHLGRNRMPSASRPTQRAGSSMVQNQGRRWSWRRPSLPSLPSFLPSSPFATMSPREFSRGSIPFFTSNPPRSFLYSVQTEPRSGERHDNNALDASHAALLTLWSRVLSATRGGGVWLEDWRGWNLTRGNLERWRMC